MFCTLQLEIPRANYEMNWNRAINNFRRPSRTVDLRLNLLWWRSRVELTIERCAIFSLFLFSCSSLYVFLFLLEFESFDSSKNQSLRSLRLVSSLSIRGLSPANRIHRELRNFSRFESYNNNHISRLEVWSFVFVFNGFLKEWLWYEDLVDSGEEAARPQRHLLLNQQGD